MYTWLEFGSEREVKWFSVINSTLVDTSSYLAWFWFTRIVLEWLKSLLNQDSRFICSFGFIKNGFVIILFVGDKARSTIESCSFVR